MCGKCGQKPFCSFFKYASCCSPVEADDVAVADFVDILLPNISSSMCGGVIQCGVVRGSCKLLLLLLSLLYVALRLFVCLSLYEFTLLWLLPSLPLFIWPFLVVGKQVTSLSLPLRGCDCCHTSPLPCAYPCTLASCGCLATRRDARRAMDC